MKTNDPDSVIDDTPDGPEGDPAEFRAREVAQRWLNGEELSKDDWQDLEFYAWTKVGSPVTLDDIQL